MNELNELNETKKTTRYGRDGLFDRLSKNKGYKRLITDN